MNARKERFCLEYAASGNATQAAIAAGYSSKTARSQGQRLLTNVDIKTRIEEIQQETRREKIADIDATPIAPGQREGAGPPAPFSCLELSRSRGKAAAGQLFTLSENPHPVRVTSCGQNADKLRDILRKFHGTGCGREPGHKERAGEQPGPLC